VLSSGAVASAKAGLALDPPFTHDSASTNLGVPGDANLNVLLHALSGPNVNTLDASVLEFDFVPNCPSTPCQVTFDYVFASEEYNEYANSPFNDVFGFFVNGVNYALLPGTNTPVSINTVNGGNPLGVNAQNPSFFRNNDQSDGGGGISIEADGLTVVLHLVAPVNAGVANHLKLAIADANDRFFNSWAFIKGNSFRVVEICNNGIDDDGDGLIDGDDPDCHVCPSGSAQLFDGLTPVAYVAGLCRADVEEPFVPAPSLGSGFGRRSVRPLALFPPVVFSLTEPATHDAAEATATLAVPDETAPPSLKTPAVVPSAGVGIPGSIDRNDDLEDGRVVLSEKPIRKRE
jgi:hypothetical protein